MSTPASAHPRLSPSGQRVVAGEKVIVVDRTIEIGPGTSAQWADEERLYYVRQPDGAFVTTIVGSGIVHVVRKQGFNHFSAQGLDHWAGYRPGTGVVFSNGVTVPSLSDPALSDDRAVWAARVIDGGAVTTESGQPRRFADRDCSEIRYARQALAWMTFLDGRRHVAGRRHQLETPTLLSVEANEGWPVPFYVGDQLWLLTLGANRLLLRPWGEAHGYVVATGDTFEPDAAALPDGRMRIVWDAGDNVLGERIIALNEPRLDLRGPIVVEPPRPPEPPVNPPVDPPKETPLQLEPKHSALIEQFAARFPPPMSNEDQLRPWTASVCEQFAFSFPGEGWGHKRASGPPSSDVIARQAGGRLWGYDLVVGAGTAGARLDAHAGPIDITGQTFLPVPPRNHLGSAPPVDPPVQPPTQPPVTPPAVNLTPVLQKLDALTGQVQALLDRPQTGDVSGLASGIDEVQRRQAQFAAEHNDLLRKIDAREIAPRCNFPRLRATEAAAAEDERSRASRILAALEALLPFLRVLAGRD